MGHLVGFPGLRITHLKISATIEFLRGGSRNELAVYDSVGVTD